MENTTKFLPVEGIPPETFDCRCRSRSALEWAIGRYQVSPDKRSGITNDANRPDVSEYIVRLVGQSITVNLDPVTTLRRRPRR